MFCITVEQKSSCNTFFLIYCKNITNFLFWVPWTCLAISIKKDNAYLWKLWCLSACKKWTLFLTYFLKYCKDITNLLLWVLWQCLIMPINNYSITLQETLMPKVLKSTYRKLWCLSTVKKSTSSFTFSLRYCYTHPRWQCQLVEDFDVYLHAKNKLHHSFLSWGITF